MITIASETTRLIINTTG